MTKLTAQQVAKELEIGMLGRAHMRISAPELRALLTERRELLAQQDGTAASDASWPSNAQQVRDFIGSHLEALEFARDDHAPDDGDRYVLTAHDFLSAVDWWADYPNLLAQQVAESNPAEFDGIKTVESHQIGDAARQAAEWISVEEQMPGDHEVVLCSAPGARGTFYVQAGWYDDERRGWWETNTHYTDAHDGQMQGVTHWMRMPAPKLPDNSLISKPDQAPYEDGYRG